MNRGEFEYLDQLASQAYEEGQRFLQSDELNAVKDAIRMAATKYPHFSVSLNVKLEVFDSGKEADLPLLQIGITSSGDEEPYIHHADSSPQRYWVKGEMCVVPHDYCPNCWHPWDNKFNNKSCPGCGFSMGKEVKFMLDSDKCPMCEESEVTPKNPTCARCGFSVPSNEVIWG